MSSDGSSTGCNLWKSATTKKRPRLCHRIGCHSRNGGHVIVLSGARRADQEVKHVHQEVQEKVEVAKQDVHQVRRNERRDERRTPRRCLAERCNDTMCFPRDAEHQRCTSWGVSCNFCHLRGPLRKPGKYSIFCRWALSKPTVNVRRRHRC